MRNRTSYYIGLIFIIIGGAALYNALFLDNLFSMRNMWPLFILLPGLFLEIDYFSNFRRRDASVLIPAGLLTLTGTYFLIRQFLPIMDNLSGPIFMVILGLALLQYYVAKPKDRGGDQGAINGTLAIMAGGEEEDFRRATPLFEAMGKSYVLVGPLGSGNTCKLTNNMIVAGNIAILSEALLLCKKSGTDLSKVLDAIRGGSAGSAVLESKSPKILKEDYKPGFKIDLHIKDLNNAILTGEKLNIPMPLTEEIIRMYRELSESGMGNDDHSALYKYFENHSR